MFKLATFQRRYGASFPYLLSCGPVLCWYCAATQWWTQGGAVTRVPRFPERYDPQGPGTSGPAGGSAWRRAPLADRSHYCVGASSPGWRAVRPLSRLDREASRSEGTSSPGTETAMTSRSRKGEAELNVAIKKNETFICMKLNLVCQVFSLYLFRFCGNLSPLLPKTYPI